MKLSAEKLERERQLEALKIKYVGKCVRHFKGGVYCILRISAFNSSHSKDLDGLAVFTYEDVEGNSYVRPLNELEEKLVLPCGQVVDRFKFI